MKLTVNVPWSRLHGREIVAVEKRDDQPENGHVWRAHLADGVHVHLVGSEIEVAA